MNQFENFQKIFIGGLNLKTNEETLKAEFEKYGAIVDCVVMRDNNTQKSRGFGFVTFEDQASVDRAMKERPHTVDGKEVDSKRAVPRNLQGKPDAYITVDKLFVGGIKDDTTEEMLSDYFAGYGNVTHIDVKKDHTTGKPRGFAFVTFDDHDPVDKALLFDQHVINNHKVELRKALNRNELVSINGKTSGPMGSSGRGRGRGASSMGYQPNMQSNFGGFNPNMDMMANFMGGYPDGFNSMNSMAAYSGNDFYNKPKMPGGPRQQIPFPNQIPYGGNQQMWGDGMSDPMMSASGNMMPGNFGDFGTNYGGAQPGSMKPAKTFTNRSNNPYNNNPGGNRTNG